MAENDVALSGVPEQSQTDGKELYDEEDPEVPADLFGMWGASSIADDEEESAADEAECSADVPSDEVSAEASEPVIADEMESPAGATEQESPEPESTDITDDDLDDLIDVPILPLPAESTEVTDDDLADIHAPILSPGDPITIPALTVPSAPDEQPAELSSPSLVEMVQEQDAAEALGGDLTATSTETPLDLFKQLRDLAEELPHNVYDAFKASKMSAKLDEIIAELEAQ